MMCPLVTDVVHPPERGGCHLSLSTLPVKIQRYQQVKSSFTAFESNLSNEVCYISARRRPPCWSLTTNDAARRSVIYSPGIDEDGDDLDQVHHGKTTHGNEVRSLFKRGLCSAKKPARATSTHGS